MQRENDEGLTLANVLIVEDEPLSAEVAAVICEAAGHRVRWARHGAEGLAQLEREGFDLALVDIRMPVLDGLAFTRQVRADARFASLPIIAVSAKAAPKDHQEMWEAGVDAIVAKPYQQRTLREAIEAAIGAGPRAAVKSPRPATPEGAPEPPWRGARPPRSSERPPAGS